MIKIQRKCSISKENYCVEVKKEDYNRWKSGEMAQDCFPYLTPEEREFLISNTTPKEWDNMFLIMKE